MDAMDLALRVAEARESRRLTQGELAQVVGMDRTVLAKIETGQRRVTALELVDLARELHRRVEWFLLPRVDAVVQHRNRNDDYSTRDIDTSLERVASDTALLIDLGALDLPPRPRVFPMPSTVREAEELGAEIRRALSMEPVGPINDLVGVVARSGLLPFAERLGESADAASLVNGHFGIAIVNSDRAVGRRRLALAHELGHFLVDDQYSTDFRVDSDDHDEKEARLDRFARSFLLPADAISQEWEILSGQGLREAAVRLASKYRVDMSTLAHRLRDLGIADENAVNEVFKARTTKSDIIEFDLVVPDDLSGTYLTREYQRAVIRAYKSEDISGERAISLFRGTITADDLPPLEPLSIQTLWSVAG
ncbi:MAG: XRE family transcriptional regulator [Propionibacteriaceae bacterium]|jgi:Zn-dependent peptidase ImmA (M78 family)/transcriptional regulator with XRE-family HTH domain|nr:XRE family transcriptional regulator [Propionibacteriaceae bacterium]